MYQSEFSDVSYLEDLNIVFVKWKKLCRQDVMLKLSYKLLIKIGGINYDVSICDLGGRNAYNPLTHTG